ncbi:hypothetical protein WN51_12650 [Melipona quadrifasciata]|uniref:Uncharacterized protein n=1 Tax=Melipona quadrifasciata TaxID=166423 RepID=A0A0M9A295_9HYME|nr:hypothetical protein WN51_12650 [Melipona quadrifasciata]
MDQRGRIVENRRMSQPLTSYLHTGVNLSSGSPVCPCLFRGELYLQHTRTTNDNDATRRDGSGMTGWGKFQVRRDEESGEVGNALKARVKCDNRAVGRKRRILTQPVGPFYAILLRQELEWTETLARKPSEKMVNLWVLALILALRAISGYM